MTGVGGHIRLILRRDRWLMPLWVIIFGLLPLTYYSSLEEGFPTQAGLTDYANSMTSTPSMVAMYGHMYNDSLGQITVWRSFVLMVLLGLVSLLAVIRHTRTEEDAGRRELLGATVTTRSAPLVSALIVVFAANIVVGLVVFATLAGGLPVAGALATALAMMTVGWVFAAVGGLAAQLTEGAGGARGIAIAMLGLAYAIRMAGDANDSAISWISPLGWVTRVRPFADEAWWVLILPVSLAIVVVGAALAVLARRDVGAGVFAARLGKPEASRSLSGPIGLAWRSHRTLLVGWSLGAAFFGLAMGGVVNNLDSMMKDNQGMLAAVQRIGGKAADIADLFTGTMLGILAVAAAAYGIQAALRMRTEETAGRSEPVLATSVGRMQWAGSHLLFAIVGPLVTVSVLGLGMGLSSGQALGDMSGQLGRVVAAALVQLPAILILPALTVALFGLLPRLAVAAWAFLGAFLLLGQVGALLNLPAWVLDLSPFSHTPKLPGGDFTVMPVLVMLGIAAALTIVGLAGFRRRDLTTA